GGRLRAGHRVPHRRPRQSARPDDRYGHAHTRRAAVRARRVRQSGPRAEHSLNRRPPRASRLQDFFDTYTRDLTADDLQRLFTRDTREAYKFFTRGVDADALKSLPWHRRALAHARVLFLAFTMKLSPARRVVYGAALLLAIIGLVNLFHGIGLVEIAQLPFVGGVGVPGPLFRQGTWSLLFAF